ncbi:hypothetical protein JOL79_11415 [Microbispora sp. RL4-1S]|uniref:Uncharacterized protein n=1 Tax=Microbispora oryzae TaxID=2806554 RepID=A0A940WJI6_9ACTN|nr:hypothetical protein [Microbispora oryzae]MBP2704422.1 hypothetical protein [Microbispora oryzae]
MTWESRDLPVLKAIVELADEGEDRIDRSFIEERTGMGHDEVQRALRALAHEEPPFFGYTDTPGYGRKEILMVFDVTGHARRTVGTWPTPESLADRIVAGLSAAADAESDEERRGWLKRTAAWFGGAGRDVLVDVASGVITKSTGLS